MMQRAITGAIFLVVMISGILYSEWSLFALVMLITAGGQWEYYRMINTTDARPKRLLGTLTGLTLVAGAFMCVKMHDPTLLVATLLLPFFGIADTVFNKSAKPYHDIAHTFFAVLYIALPMALIGIMGLQVSDRYQAGVVMFYFATIWIYDTFAYLSGRFFGKHKLLERVSPKKTWEGAAGGFLTGIAASYFATPFMPEGTAWWQCAAFAAVVMVTGTLGDLSVSVIKRSVGAKDTGGLLPGHGGLLDRFDSQLLSAAPAYLTLWLLM
ncbi:MAG: phosphatidate cytidylyltransferase [Flavobacteriales bacterium]|nr:phosphatidate cytidylyltransferase [Flavobacteriales bacterium]MCB9448825.1 phosphatidate cytidylyltransferase [Flavobacteriales bacterium]